MSFTAAHWGVFELRDVPAGAVPELAPFAADPRPSPIGKTAARAYASSARVTRPAVRRSWIRDGWGSKPELRGSEPFVQVSWEDAVELAARALEMTIATRGNEAIFGGSYGWSSAGRFHHAQSQVHRFLNSIGGYVRSVDTYSLGAGHVIMPHIVGPMHEILGSHTGWQQLAEHTTLFLCFGGLPAKNSQICQGLVGRHTLEENLRRMAASGARFVNISPFAGDLDVDCEWIPIRPNTDTALLLALCHTLAKEELHDRSFLSTHCVGFENFAGYLAGHEDGVEKTSEWASAITGVDAARIRLLARQLSSNRSMINIAWALQRAHHGEQPFWAVVALASMLGQVGLPGGGFGFGYAAINGIGSSALRFGGPTLPQGSNAVKAFCPVARITDMLDHPGESFRYNGGEHTYPDIDLIYWAGGNPFHHHQDLGRMARAWRKPRSVIVNEQFWTATAKFADIVFPVTSTLERDDIGYGSWDNLLVPMRAATQPIGESKDDYEVFALLSDALGDRQAFTEGRSSHQWLEKMYDECAGRARSRGLSLPAFAEFWQGGPLDLPRVAPETILLRDFREDPQAHPLSTPSGRIEIFSERIHGFGLDDCAGHPTWYEPREWLGSKLAQRFPLHLISDQPHTKLHSQLDHSEFSRANKIRGREPILIHPMDAYDRSIADGDLVRVFNERGSCICGARVVSEIRRGVVKLSTGAWFDPTDWSDARHDKHGNPNAVTLDLGASSLSQGCAAQSCLVEVERCAAEVPEVTAFALPAFEPKS